jgi:HEAT repeat protein
MNTLSVHRLSITLLVALALMLMTSRTHANGWEHGAIPFGALLKALENESPEMRRRAAQSLGIRGQPEAVEPILQRLAKPEENPFVRSALYIALGKLGDRRAITVLEDCVKKETRDELRSDCVSAVGRLGEKSTLPLLLAALQEDASFLVQSSVVDALGGFSEDLAVKALAALVTGDGNRSLRQRAIRSLGQTGSQKAVKPLLKVLNVSRSDNERLLIVNSLTPLGSQAATEPLKKLLHTTENAQLRIQIVIALGAIRDGDTYPTLADLLTDKVPAVRYFAVVSLHKTGRREAAVAIGRLSLEISRRMEQHSTQALLTDPLPVLADLSLQVVALQAITDLDASKGLAALLYAARSRNVARNSAVALKIAEGFYRQRRAALNGLGYTGSPKAAVFLAGPAGVGDADFRLRAVAVRSLGVLGFPDAVEEVLVALNDPVAEVRWTAASVIGRLGDAKAVGPLIERLSDINSEVRRQAALSLGYLGDRRAYGELVRLAREDKSKNVQAASAYSLQLFSK